MPKWDLVVGETADGREVFASLSFRTESGKEVGRIAKRYGHWECFVGGSERSRYRYLGHAETLGEAMKAVEKYLAPKAFWVNHAWREWVLMDGAKRVGGIVGVGLEWVAWVSTHEKRELFKSFLEAMKWVEKKQGDT